MASYQTDYEEMIQSAYTDLLVYGEAYLCISEYATQDPEPMPEWFDEVLQ